MSVKIMGLVWDLDLPSNEKFILLAYADHANHEGGNIWPAVETVSKKTGYHERSVQRITKDLESKGFLVENGSGPKGTNKWGIPVSERGDKIAPVTSDTKQGDIPSGDIPSGDKMTPKQTNRKKKPSVKRGAQAPKPLKANQIPQVILFREVTTKYPSKGSQFTVITSVDKAGDRLGREVVADDLLPFYREWCDRGYNPMAVKWLEWAVSGEIPKRTNGQKPIQDRKSILMEAARG